MTNPPTTPPNVFVLAGDYGYIRQIETTLKSICYHNHNSKVYIFNQDIPQEWFVDIRKKMKLIDSRLIDIKLLGIGLNTDWTLPPAGPHINYMTYARYFIPHFVKEDVALYLDCDVIVTQSLAELFKIDLSNYYIAAAKVVYGLEDRFNAGVMLINNQRWKKENLMQELIAITNRDHDHISEADQTVLNQVIGNQYYLLDDRYNFQIGYDQVAYMRGQHFLFEIPLTPLPAIIHYLSPDKPWNTFSSSRLREVWWQYSQLEWQDIAHGTLVNDAYASFTGHCLILTNSQHLEHIKTLAQSLPQVCFHVACYTEMGEILRSLASYENIVLHPCIMRQMVQILIREVDLYLDINHEDKFYDNLEMVKDAGLPIVSFDSTQNHYHSDYLFSSTCPQDMIQFIDQFCKKK